MQLEQLNVVLRPRRPWQAIDLGLRMASRWWFALMKHWLCVSLPLFLLLTPLLATRETAYLAPLILWWMKPLLERPLLYYTSRAVFGEYPGVKEVLRNLGNIMRPQAIAWLLWRRLSVTRSFDMPITLLENLNGKDRAQRIAILHLHHASPASWLTLLGVHIEMFLAMAIMLLVESMLPQPVDLQWLPDIGDELTSYAVWYALSYIAMSLVAPYYVTSGFALYLNRRAQLEAWDIEVVFRLMREKYCAANAVTSTLAACGIALSLALLSPPPAIADTTATPPAASAAPAPKVPTTPLASRELISSVMQAPEFNEHVTYKIPKWFDSNEDDKHEAWWVRWLRKWLRQWRDEETDIGRISLWIARIVEFALWTALVIGGVMFAWRYRAYLRQWLPRRGQQRPKVWRMRRLAIREGIDLDELPQLDDIGESARMLWLQREPRAAMALLYVASLYELAAIGVPIDDSHTESECLAIAGEHLSANAHAFLAKVSDAWLRQAYAHQRPPQEDFMALCDEWKAYLATIHHDLANRGASAATTASTAGALHGG